MKKILFLLVLFLFLPFDTHAVSFSASFLPSVQHILIKPGTAIKSVLKLHNSGDPITLQLKFAKVQTENDRLIFTDVREAPISFSDPAMVKPFIMSSNEFKDIDIDVIIPENAQDQEMYYAVIAESIPQPAPQGKVTVHLQGSVSSLLLLTIKNDANLEFTPKIVLFDTKPQFRLSLFGKRYQIFDTSKPVPIVLTVQNQGKNAFKVHGWISITGPSNIDTIPLSSKYLLADSQMTMASPSHSMIFSSLKTGIYKMQASVVAGEQGKATTASTSFIVLPLRFMALSLILALSVPILMILYIKKKQK